MPRHQKIGRITNIDIVTLKHFADAQLKQEPTPPAFNDTLVRLAKNGLIHGGQGSDFMITKKGKIFLDELI